MTALIQSLGFVPPRTRARPAKVQVQRDCTMMTLIGRIILWSSRNAR